MGVSSLSRRVAQRPAVSSTGERASSAKVISPRNRDGGTSRGQYQSFRRLRRSQRRGTSASIITTSCTRPGQRKSRRLAGGNSEKVSHFLGSCLTGADGVATFPPHTNQMWTERNCGRTRRVSRRPAAACAAGLLRCGGPDLLQRSYGRQTPRFLENLHLAVSSPARHAHGRRGFNGNPHLVSSRGMFDRSVTSPLIATALRQSLPRGRALVAPCLTAAGTRATAASSAGRTKERIA